MDMEQTLYDVFISYSRKDYVDEHGNIIPGNIISQIKDSFQNAGIHYWFDEEGIYSGDKYMEKLADAIFASTAFVFISSINSNASEWTAGEIGTAHLYKKKIIPFRLDDSPFARSIIVKIAHLDYIDCNPNPDKAIMDLVGSILAARDEEEKKQREEEERRKKERMKARRAEIQQEIQNLASDLRRVGSQQQNVIDQIIAQKAMLEETDKICPVCQKKAQLSQRYCERCGFTYPLLYGLADNDTDTVQLVTLRGVWKDANSQQTKQQELRNDNIRLKGIIEKQSQQLQKLEKERKNLENLQHLLDAAKKEITEYVSKLKESEESYSKLSSLVTCRDQELKKSYSEIEKYMEKIAAYRKTIDEQKEKIDILTRELALAKNAPTSIEGKSKPNSQESTGKVKNTDYKVVLRSIGLNKAQVAKCIKNCIRITSDEAEYFVSHAPIDLFGSYSLAEANKIKTELISVGATAAVREYNT